MARTHVWMLSPGRQDHGHLTGTYRRMKSPHLGPTPGLLAFPAPVHHSLLFPDSLLQPCLFSFNLESLSTMKIPDPNLARPLPSSISASQHTTLTLLSLGCREAHVSNHKQCEAHNLIKLPYGRI